MQHVVHVLAGRAAGFQIANVPFDEGKAAPGFRPHQVAHHVQVFLIAREEIVQTDHGLAQQKQVFQQIGADEARNARDKPAGGRGLHVVAQGIPGSHKRSFLKME